MGALGLWIRSEWRSGWRALVGLTVLVAIGGGVTIAAWAGARRADSAFDRFLDDISGPLDVSAAGIQSDLSAFDGAWSELTPKIAAVPGVDGVTPVSWMAVAFESDGRPSEFFALATGDGAGANPPPGFHIVDGRTAVAADEVIINEETSSRTGIVVGGRIALRSYAPDQLEAFIGSDLEDDRGPRIDAEVVGLFRSPEDISDNPEPMVVVSQAFHDAYADQIVHCDCSFWVAAGRNDVERVAADLGSVIDGFPVAVHEVNSVLRARVERAVSLEVGALRIGAIVAAIATTLLIAQALTRHVTGGRDSTGALRAIGTTRPQVARAWTMIMAPVALLGAGGAVLLAVALSPMFPRGLARRAEVNSGLRVDSTALLAGAIAIAVTVTLFTAAAALLVAPAPERSARRSLSWGSAFSPPAALGTSFALDPARDRSRIVAISAIGGLAIAIAGAVTVALVEQSTAEVLSTPAAFSTDWDLELTAQPDDPDAVIGAVVGEQSVEAFALQYAVTGNQFVITGPAAEDLVSPQTFDAMKGSMGAILDSGRQPETADDVVIGKAIADAIGAGIGDEVTVDAGLQGPQVFLVSGIGRLSDGDETDRAFVVTPDGLTRLQDAERLSINGAFVRLGDVDDGTRDRLEAIGFIGAVPPSRVSNLSEIGTVPRLLAVALAVLGLSGVIHGLLVAGTRRRRDLAIVRAIGFTPHQAASTVRWQGIVITVIASIIGVPLGLLVGRVVWKQIAAGVGAVDLVSIPWTALALAPIVSVMAVTVAASICGWRASQLPPARVLRTE